MFMFTAGHFLGGVSWLKLGLLRMGYYDPFSRISILSSWFVIIIYLAIVSAWATYCLQVYLAKK